MRLVLALSKPSLTRTRAVASTSASTVARDRCCEADFLGFVAGLRAIPGTFYEAARIDGLGEWAILRKITLPLLKPTTVFLVVFSSIGFLRIFDQVYNINTNDPGGPLNSTKPLVLMIYQTAFGSYEMGYAAAQTVVLFLILLVISLVQLRIMRDR